MTSSSSLGKKTAAVSVLIVLVIIMSPAGIRPTSAQEMSHVCNAREFDPEDHRRVCAYHLLDNLLGWTDPLPVGEFYDDYDCDWGKNTVYGYRMRENGTDAALCLVAAKNILQKKQCVNRIGGRAWGEGCYMRFEIYPIVIEKN
ncbi:unnamed protein product [Linum trigynum]|uniref:Gnk2-homologous domain-containing protein n=1 Tax=Linum trigynum TaxID=586398 RepID=A0AAV2EZM8_9ROSI